MTKNKTVNSPIKETLHLEFHSHILTICKLMQTMLATTTTTKRTEKGRVSYWIGVGGRLDCF
jgi:hypothetical protein